MAFIKMKVSMFFYPEGQVALFISLWPIYFYSLFATFVGVIISATLKFSLNYFKISARQQELKNNQLLAELKYLKMQVNPHFLFNTLNNLLYLTREKSDLAPVIVEKLATMMRYMLEQGDKEKTLLSNEIDFLQAYIELEKLRITGVEIEFEIEGMIDNKSIPPLVLLPVIENTFKHGIDKSKNDNYIGIKIFADDLFLSLTTKNLIRKQVHKRSGIGLTNLQKRLELIYDKANFTLQQQETGGYYISSMKINYV
jgi:two-component system, LytTR family, sensor histidine kinase AlgZ